MTSPNTRTTSMPPASQEPKSTQSATADVDDKIPSSALLAKAADCQIFTATGDVIPFKSLYWVTPGVQKRFLILFIRHFFCGNCQEFLRTLSVEMPPESLPQDVSVVIIGCGSPTLISSYIEETRCPYPIYSDPSKRLYTVLGMHRTLSLGWKGPEYIQHTLIAGVAKSIMQGLKRIPAGDATSGGDMRLNGGEFVFEVEGAEEFKVGSKGNTGFRSVAVTWCHRMTNTRDHAEVQKIREILSVEHTVRRRPERRWTADALRRSVSNRRQSWLERTSSISRSRSRRKRSSERCHRKSPVTEDTVSESAPVPEAKVSDSEVGSKQS